LNGHRPFCTLLHEEFEPYAEKVESIIGEMHQKGYVHGDIRSPNILYHPATKGSKLFDFDVANECTYIYNG
jgi:tRNA A-37 threonylcarbamoyl transferase component Bud32